MIGEYFAGFAVIAFLLALLKLFRIRTAFSSNAVRQQVTSYPWDWLPLPRMIDRHRNSNSSDRVGDFISKLELHQGNTSNLDVDFEIGKFTQSERLAFGRWLLAARHASLPSLGIMPQSQASGRSDEADSRDARGVKLHRY